MYNQSGHLNCKLIPYNPNALIFLFNINNKLSKRCLFSISMSNLPLSCGCFGPPSTFYLLQCPICHFLESSPNLCVNSSFSYVVLSTLLLSSRDLTEWSLVYHSTLSYQRFYDLHSIHYDHLEGLHQLI